MATTPNTTPSGNCVSEEDTRTPAELLDFIAAKGPEADAALARLRHLLLAQQEHSSTGHSSDVHACASEFTRERQALEPLMSHIAHEIRGPIQRILNKLSILRLGTLTQKEVENAFKGVVAESAILNNLLGRISMLHSITSGSLRHRKSRVSLPTTLEQVIQAFLPIAEKYGVEVTYTANPTSSPSPILDRDLLAQAIYNLLDNAIKYSLRDTHKPPRVIVTLHATASLAEISIQNRGIGIPADEIPKIFQPLYRSRAAVSHHPNATGIGLAIVDAFAKQCGAKVEVTSTPTPEGNAFFTTFRLCIPTP